MLKSWFVLCAALPLLVANGQCLSSLALELESFLLQRAPKATQVEYWKERLGNISSLLNDLVTEGGADLLKEGAKACSLSADKSLCLQNCIAIASRQNASERGVELTANDELLFIQDLPSSLLMQCPLSSNLKELKNISKLFEKYFHERGTFDGTQLYYLTVSGLAVQQSSLDHTAPLWQPCWTISSLLYQAIPYMDIVILIDVGLTMTGPPISVAKLVAMEILDHLTIYHRVTVVTAGATVQYLTCGGRLVEVTERNRKTLKGQINELQETIAIAQYRQAIASSLETLNSTAAGLKAVLLLTAGTLEVLRDLFDSANGQQSTVVFSFLLGSPVDVLSAREIGCHSNQGYYASIRDAYDIPAKIQLIPQVLSRLTTTRGESCQLSLGLLPHYSQCSDSVTFTLPLYGSSSQDPNMEEVVALVGATMSLQGLAGGDLNISKDVGGVVGVAEMLVQNWSPLDILVDALVNNETLEEVIEAELNDINLNLTSNYTLVILDEFGDVVMATSQACGMVLPDQVSLFQFSSSLTADLVTYDMYRVTNLTSNHSQLNRNVAQWTRTGRLLAEMIEVRDKVFLLIASESFLPCLSENNACQVSSNANFEVCSVNRSALTSWVCSAAPANYRPSYWWSLHASVILLIYAV